MPCEPINRGELRLCINKKDYPKVAFYRQASALIADRVSSQGSGCLRHLFGSSRQP